MERIDNIEYRPGLTGYSAIGDKGAAGADGNRIYFVDAPANESVQANGSIFHNIFKSTMGNEDFAVFSDGYICKKISYGYGQIITNLLCSDIDLSDYFGTDYYIDRHSADGSISFNISPSNIVRDGTSTYELRSKYSNEILTIR